MNTILAIGYSEEKTFNYFISKAKAESIINIDVLDLSRIKEAQIIEIIENGNELIIILGEEVFEIHNYFGFYNRCFFSNSGFHSKDIILSKLVSSINSFLENTNKLVINKHSSVSHNGNKFIHIHELEKHGFSIPKTFICGNKDSLLKTHKGSLHLINKSCSGYKTIAVKVDDNLLKRATQLSICPSLFQEQVIGSDVRIHLVGDKFFAEMITSDEIDYRYNTTQNIKFSTTEVPQIIQNLCISYCKKENLIFAGIDFKIDKNGVWYILEINPMPGYEGYDKRLKGNITKALLNLYREEELNQSEAQEDLFISVERRPDIQVF